MSSHGLTARQAEILRFIAQCIARGMPPTARETCTHFGWGSTYTAFDAFRRLARDGYIVIERKKARGIRLTARALDVKTEHVDPVADPVPGLQQPQPTEKPAP